MEPGRRLILERAGEVGGSWRDNTYPGIGVDIPSLAFQYSFARNPNWSRLFAPGAEVRAYHADVARRFGLGPHLRFHTDVVAEHWDERRHAWRLSTRDGRTITGRFVVNAVAPSHNQPDNRSVRWNATTLGNPGEAD